MILRFLRNMAAFDAGYVIGVILGGVTVATFITVPRLIAIVMKAVMP